MWKTRKARCDGHFFLLADRFSPMENFPAKCGKERENSVPVTFVENRSVEKKNSVENFFINLHIFPLM